MNLNVKDITTAIFDLLDQDLGIREEILEGRIVRAGTVNENPNFTPWIGIYKGTVDYVPRTLGRHSASWQATVESRILIQIYSPSGASEAEDKLENLINMVMRIMLDNPTLNGTVQMVLGFKVEYRFLEDEGESSFFQMAMLSVTSEVATG